MLIVDGGGSGKKDGGVSVDNGSEQLHLDDVGLS